MVFAIVVVIVIAVVVAVGDGCRARVSSALPLPFAVAIGRRLLQRASERERSAAQAGKGVNFALCCVCGTENRKSESAR